MKKLGTPTTLGEFRKMTEIYMNNELLQFRNQPRHELFFDDEQGLIFQEEATTDIHIALKKMLAENAYKNGNMAIDEDVTKLCKVISYLECQMGMISRFIDDENKEMEKESIKRVMQQAAKIIQQP